jgi:hypothetical protein
MKTLALAAALFSASAAIAEDGLFSVLAADLARELPPGEVRIGVGNFPYRDSSTLSPFSMRVREEMEMALRKTGKFKVITRDRLGELEDEGKFQRSDILEPDTRLENVSVEGIEGLVRGKFYDAGKTVTVVAELVLLQGGEIKGKTKVEIPVVKIQESLWPEGSMPPERFEGAAIVPQNLSRSEENVRENKSRPASFVPQNFGIQIFPVGARRGFEQGERVSFRVRSDRDCHIAVLCHQSDGSTVVLFPNRHNTETLIRANESIDIPGRGRDNFGIEVVPPFGSDVVEVVACTSLSELHKSVLKSLSLPGQDSTYISMSRGLAVRDIETAVSKAGPSAQWGRDSVVISTFPRL